ncbi:MAG: hypothetical protein WA688_04860 [Thermoplasmata archaeon]
MTGRELAWRVLANELAASSVEEKGSGDKAPSYVISPLGARMNRVLVTGTITAAERAGTDPTQPFVRARLTDPTGTLAVTAGSYQPQGQADLERIARPTRVLLVGKPTLFRNSGPSPMASVRAESVLAVPESDYRTLTAEAGFQTLERLELVLRLRAPAPPSDAELARSGVSPFWRRGARASIAQYPSLDPTPYYESLRAVLVTLRAGPVPEPPPPAGARPVEAAPEVTRTVHPLNVPATPSPPPELRVLEGRLLEILDELAEGSPDGYADMDELAERAARHGLDGERMEALLNYLSENGTLEEPLVGKFRRTEGPPRE